MAILTQKELDELNARFDARHKKLVELAESFVASNPQLRKQWEDFKIKEGI